MSDKRCASCIHCGDVPNAGAATLHGLCRRYAPRPDSRGVQPPWPRVIRDADWCGEWKPAAPVAVTSDSVSAPANRFAKQASASRQ